MAVSEGLPEIEVSIHINGSEDRCAEYNDPGAPPTPVTSGPAMHFISKIIESHDDANFAIHIVVQKPEIWIKNHEGLGFCTHIDGHVVDDKIFLTQHVKDSTFRWRVEGIETNSDEPEKSTIKHFCFAPIKTVQEHNGSIGEDRKIAQHLGTIEVAVYRAIYLRGHQRVTRGFRSQTELTEKTLKGKSISHETIFSGEKKIKATEWIDADLPDNDRKIARFFFRYKSRASLQTDGIMPRDSSPRLPTLPPPSLSQRPTVVDLTKADNEGLAKERLDQLDPPEKQKMQDGAKREADADANHRPRKIYKIDRNGAIDLTDD